MQDLTDLRGDDASGQDGRGDDSDLQKLLPHIDKVGVHFVEQFDEILTAHLRLKVELWSFYLSSQPAAGPKVVPAVRFLRDRVWRLFFSPDTPGGGITSQQLLSETWVLPAIWDRLLGLAHLVLQRDFHAPMARFHTRWAPIFERRVRGWTHHAPPSLDRENIVSECLLAVIQRNPFEFILENQEMPSTEFSRETLRIARNVTRTIVKREARRGKRLRYLHQFCRLPEQSGNASTGPVEPSDTRYASPSEAAERHELLFLLESALKSLSPEEGELLRLYFWEGYTLQEIATKHGTTKQTICRRMQAALRKLRKELPSNEP